MAILYAAALLVAFGSLFALFFTLYCRLWPGANRGFYVLGAFASSALTTYLLRWGLYALGMKRGSPEIGMGGLLLIIAVVVLIRRQSGQERTL